MTVMTVPKQADGSLYDVAEICAVLEKFFARQN